MRKISVLPLVAASFAAFVAPISGWAQNSAPIEWNEYKFRSIVRADGQIVKEFATEKEAFTASEGDNSNSSTKNGWEVIVFRPKACPALGSMVSGFATYSLYRDPDSTVGTPIEKLMTEYVGWYLKNSSWDGQTVKVNPAPAGQFEDRLQRLKAIAASMAMMAKADKDGRPVVPLSLSFPYTFAKPASYFKLEVEDTGAPQIGGRVNDAYVYQATSPCGGQGSPDALRKAFGDRGVPNGFADMKTALTAAALLDQPYLKLIVEQGGKLWLYRVGNDINTNISDPNKYLAQFNDLKLNPGYRLRVVAIGKGKEMQTAGQ